MEFWIGSIQNGDRRHTIPVWNEAVSLGMTATGPE